MHDLLLANAREFKANLEIRKLENSKYLASSVCVLLTA